VANSFSAHLQNKPFKTLKKVDAVINRFDAGNFKSFCDESGRRDVHLQSILNVHGYPPMWVRPANFSTLVLIILEQQVSLASAYAAFKKLIEKTGTVTPEKILKLSDEELKGCYFSKQKIRYTRLLAEAIETKKLVLQKLNNLPDDEVREILIKQKGIGDWTVDIYLMQALQRMDVFPAGDLALIKSIKEVKQMSTVISKSEIVALAESWKPYRTVATMIFWHHYIQTRKIKTGL
jgi:DNA-3-methyladenine glycosylase II